MLRATAIVRRPAVKADRVADILTLDHEARHRRRVALTGEGERIARLRSAGRIMDRLSRQAAEIRRSARL